MGRRFSAEPPLTDRERRILQLIADGNTRPSTAAAMFVCLSTVTVDLKIACAKLGVRGQTAAIKVALEHHLIRDNRPPGAGYAGGSGKPLTDREREVLACVATGMPARDGAALLCVTIATYHKLRYRAYCKTGITGRTQLVKDAVRLGLTESVSA